MRRAIAALAVCGLVVGASMPATAAKKKAKSKKIQETHQVTALPFPNLSSATGTPTPGCSAGQEGVHKMTFPFQTPGAGTLTVTTEGFTGDWDLYVFDGEGVVLGRGDQEQIPGGAPPEEEIVLALKSGTTVDIVACNWLGEPQNEFTYTYVYTPAPGGGKHRNH